ncbi:hypothetical protein P7K49_005636 [Saguinus oedipus]|uniref:Uncharacterized protein n=1 Tax=Saguinus oedipus TaxID=9490 RepID=A0ABQ9W0Y2_SAGOE|nr:hypothetical protein P7K49_005636 [Saguinus oedipus]
MAFIVRRGHRVRRREEPAQRESATGGIIKARAKIRPELQAGGGLTLPTPQASPRSLQALYLRVLKETRSSHQDLSVLLNKHENTSLLNFLSDLTKQVLHVSQHVGEDLQGQTGGSE